VWAWLFSVRSRSVHGHQQRGAAPTTTGTQSAGSDRHSMTGFGQHPIHLFDRVGPGDSAASHRQAMANPADPPTRPLASLPAWHRRSEGDCVGVQARTKTSSKQLMHPEDGERSLHALLDGPRNRRRRQLRVSHARECRFSSRKANRRTNEDHQEVVSKRLSLPDFFLALRKVRKKQ